MRSCSSKNGRARVFSDVALRSVQTRRTISVSGRGADGAILIGVWVADVRVRVLVITPRDVQPLREALALVHDPGYRDVHVTGAIVRASGAMITVSASRSEVAGPAVSLALGTSRGRYVTCLRGPELGALERAIDALMAKPRHAASVRRRERVA